MNKKLSFMSLAAVLALASCSSDDMPGTGNGAADGPQVYMTFKLDNVANTRSTTNEGDDAWGNSNDGVEIGQDNENTISTVYVFLVPSAGGDAIVSATSTTLVGPSSENYYTVSFNQTDIKDYAENEVKVMVYCNLPSETTYAADKIITANSWGDGDDGDFVMSNADTSFTITLPTEANLKLYNTVENPFNLGTINVKRAAARFDIKQLGTYIPEGETNPVTNQYAISGNENIYIELTDVALVNHSKSWYVQHRVSANDDGSDAVLCGNENRTNFVIDTDWAFKTSWIKGTSLADNFENLSTDPISSWTALSDITANDNDNDWNNPNTKGDYQIWRYANENTLPTSNQLHALSTGVVFRGEIKCIATTGDLADAFTAGEDLFVFRNKLYGSVAMVKAAANTDAALRVAYENCVTEVADGENTTYTVDEDKAKEANFTIFKATEVEGVNKYYVYYHYWNRHNDNGNATAMGPMEFAVVRNNVYKLAVTDIKLFGSPDPEDPEDPDTPDEQDKVYFNVDVKIQPWVVRINNIEF